MKKFTKIFFLLFIALSFCMIVTNTEAAKKTEIKPSHVKLKKDSVVYSINKANTKKGITVDVTVKVGKEELDEGDEYTLTYANNRAAGTASVIIKGINDYKGQVTKTFKITRDNICTSSDVYFSTSDFKERKQFKLPVRPKIYMIHIEALHTKLSNFYTEGRDYKVDYVVNGNKCVAKITGLGNLCGTAEIPYIANTIVSAKKYGKEADAEQKKLFWKNMVFSKNPASDGSGFGINVMKNTDLNKTDCLWIKDKEYKQGLWFYTKY